MYACTWEEMEWERIIMSIILLFSFICSSWQDLLKFLFREAKIHNAVIFFDECEPLFETRDSRTNPSLTLLLTEERVHGIVAVVNLRKKIWKKLLSKKLPISSLDIKRLAER